MKDYTLTIDNNDDREQFQKKFILKYEVKENKNGQQQIVVYYADGREEYVDLINESKILLLMECQVNDYKVKMQNYEMEYRSKINLLNLENRLGILLIGIIVIMGMMSIGTASLSVLLLSSVVPIFLFGSLVVDIVNIIKQKKLVDDFNKMMLFVENKDKINKHIIDRDNKFINEIRNILEKVCVDKENGKRRITINSIDKISLKKLENIVKNVKLKETFETIKWGYTKKKEIVIEKGKEIEQQVLEERRKPFESLLTIEDVARLRSMNLEQWKVKKRVRKKD